MGVSARSIILNDSASTTLLASCNVYTMAEGTSRQRKRKSSTEVDQRRPFPTKRVRIVSELKTCSYKSCSDQDIDPRADCYVEIKAALPTKDDPSFPKQSTIAWSPTGDARFHRHCWDALLKSSRARNPKNIIIKLCHEDKALLRGAAKTAEYHDSKETVKREAFRIARLLQSSQHCVVFSGAGISTSAGIGDYRGKEGKWTEEDRKATQGSSSVREDEGVPYENLRPTYTHEALVKLLEMGLIKHLISQNGDGLHGLSGVSPDQLSELHGNVFIEVCEQCGHRYNRPFYVLDDNASQYFEELEDYGSTDIPKPKHAVTCPLCGLCHRTGRKCEQKRCKGHLKDSIINFGDNLEKSILTQAKEHADRADLCLSLGTTMQVTPACELVRRGQKPLRLVIINRQKTGFDALCLKQDNGETLGSRVFGDCDEVLAQVMSHLLTAEELKRWEVARGERMKGYDSLRTTPQ